MAADELNKYEVGQEVWFIAGSADPIVKKAEIVEKRIIKDKERELIYLEFKADDVYRDTACTTIYKTKAEASKHLKEAQEKALLQILCNCESKIRGLKMEIEKDQAELQRVEEDKKKYSEKLNEVRK